MFVQFFILFISTIVSYLLLGYLLKRNYRRFYFINGIVKYYLNCTIKNAVYTHVSSLSDLDNYIFYSTEQINCENYIYDKNLDHYYLIELF
jgi:hypothetical protein